MFLRLVFLLLIRLFLRLVFRLLIRLIFWLIFRLFLHFFRNFTIFFRLFLRRSLPTVPTLGITSVVTPATPSVPVQPLWTVHRVLPVRRACDVLRTVLMLNKGNLSRSRVRRALANLLRQADTGLGQGTSVETGNLLGNLPRTSGVLVVVAKGFDVVPFQLSRAGHLEGLSVDAGHVLAAARWMGKVERN